MGTRLTILVVKLARQRLLPGAAAPWPENTVDLVSWSQLQLIMKTLLRTVATRNFCNHDLYSSIATTRGDILSIYSALYCLKAEVHSSHILVCTMKGNEILFLGHLGVSNGARR